MFYVYVLLSLKDSKRYVGFTIDLERRLHEHFTGNNVSTKNRRPLKLVYTESYATKSEAMRREKFFKSGKGRKFLNIIIKR